MQDSSNIIHTLSSETINQIAAGEVVQRPSSVVKELMENAIDAGADKIDVVIQDAGRTLVQVVDNGKGMSAQDSVKAFERHATSKINGASDLYALTTMGFRGEALASIAAVSRVELKTRREADELGSRVEINGGELASQEFISCASGTQILVKDLFYNIPVRRKFLKKNETELRNILNVFQQIALVYPSIRFTLSHNGTSLFSLEKENYRQRISSVCGSKTGKELLPINVDTVLARISGFVSTPESAVKKQPSQYFFVNGRYIQHPYFAKAVQLGYEKILPADVKPQFFIYFDVDPDKIDVNIHPTKTEVKFEDEQALFSIIVAAVKEALASSNAMPSLLFDQEDRIEIPVTPADFSTLKTPPVTHNSNYNPFSSTRPAHASGSSFAAPHKQSVEGWESLYDSVKCPPANDDPAPFEAVPDVAADLKPQFKGFVYGGKYIVCSSDAGVLFVNSYRASVRVAYDRFMAMLSSGSSSGQMLMFPEILELTPLENSVFAENRASFEAVGYSFEPFGPTAYQVVSVPSMVADSDAVAIIKENVKDSESKDVALELKERLVRSLAIKSAGRTSVESAEAAGRLTDELNRSSMPAFTPDGLPVFFTLSIDDIKKHIG